MGGISDDRLTPDEAVRAQRQFGGQVGLAGDETGRLVFLNGLTGEVLTEIAGNFGAIRAIEFSDDGVKLATVGDDGTTRLFGIANTR